jgi:hypothetical protein
MLSLDFWLGVVFLAFVPFGMAAYGAHVAAESILDARHRRNIRLRFWGIGLLGLVVALLYQYRTTKSDEAKQASTLKWQQEMTSKFDLLIKSPVSNEQQKSAIILKHETSISPGRTVAPLTLKQLFETDFKLFANSYQTTLTIGSKTQKFPEMTLKFTAKLWMDLREGTEILGFYIPTQDADPEKSSQKTVLLCRHLPDRFSEIIKQLKGLEVSSPIPRGSMLKSTDLTLSRRVYIYHEDFMSPQDTGDLVREYEARQLLPEFRSTDYLATQELLNVAGQRK